MPYSFFLLYLGTRPLFSGSTLTPLPFAVTSNTASWCQYKSKGVIAQRGIHAGLRWGGCAVMAWMALSFIKFLSVLSPMVGLSPWRGTGGLVLFMGRFLVDLCTRWSQEVPSGSAGQSLKGVLTCFTGCQAIAFLEELRCIIDSTGTRSLKHER